MNILNGDELYKYCQNKADDYNRRDDSPASMTIFMHIASLIRKGSFAVPPSSEFIRGVEACIEITKAIFGIKNKESGEDVPFALMLIFRAIEQMDKLKSEEG